VTLGEPGKRKKKRNLQLQKRETHPPFRENREKKTLLKKKEERKGGGTHTQEGPCCDLLDGKTRLPEERGESIRSKP